MSAEILEGRPIAEAIRAELAAQIEEMERPPRLVAVMAGDDPGARAYARMQARACEEVGIDYGLRELEADITQSQLLEAVSEVNLDPLVDGIILQLPLPDHLGAFEAQSSIDPMKDVDGVHPMNLGLVTAERPVLAPCTAQAVVRLVEESGAQIRGAEVVMVGRSVIVGKPAALMLLDRGATVTICRSTTRDLAFHTSRAEILIVAIGQAEHVRGDQIKPGAVVIDVGMNYIPGEGDEKGRYVGDVAFEEAKEVAGVITPVPGGVGPMTVTMLLRNTVEAARRQRGRA
ncbi:MAG: bifunctional 5,10-methylenetetrahydrofolate dehydrogenase/5,10-methenyltetrahydrofolate cyclohydrolase [Armatimonadota bacterium]|nr:bifunctional 5,10-methylenetetrahydrofolate dehydrogenase/5,10-methenyltetrahydrofolate cyclohydrolase [Armatimonadota bacterium]